MERPFHPARLYPLFWLAFLALAHFTMGLRPEHGLFVSLLLACYFIHEKSRRFAIDFLPFQLFGILYDFLRIIPKGWVGPIHIAEPYRMEVTLFRFLGLGPNFLPTDFFRLHHHASVDILAGFAYALHVIVPLGLGFYLWHKKTPMFSAYAWGFLVMNLLAFAAYILYPAAPPWYVTAYGFKDLGWNVIGQAAGLSRIDALTGFSYFTATYARAAWVYGAIPSMHAGFPIFTALFARKVLGKGRWFFYGFALLVNFAAVYLEHHYVIDLIAGWLIAVGMYQIVVNKASLSNRKSP